MMKLMLLLIAAIGMILQDGSNAYPSENKRAVARNSLSRPSGSVPHGLKQSVRVRRQDDDFSSTDEFSSGDSGMTGGSEFGGGGQGFDMGGQGFDMGGQGFGGGGQGFGGMGGQSGPGQGFNFNFGNMQKMFANIAQKLQGFFQKAVQSFSGMMSGAGGGHTTGSMPGGFDQQAGMM